MDAETAKLFPEVNPNIDEIIEREKAVDPNNVIVEDKLNADLEVKEKTGPVSYTHLTLPTIE